MAKPSGVYQGDDAYTYAQRKARYGGYEWIYWIRRDGQRCAAVMTPVTLKQAMLETGTQGCRLRFSSYSGHALAAPWRFCALWLRQFRYYNPHRRER